MKTKKQFYWEAYNDLYPNEGNTLIELNMDLNPALEKAMDNYALAREQELIKFINENTRKGLHFEPFKDE